MENRPASLTIQPKQLEEEGQEPTPKKQKMSTISAIARRKIAIFFGYCGVGYQGMQRNPGTKTIEGDLEEALLQAGGVPDHDRGYPRRYDWARSVRTDKGVSAVGQVVSGRFYVDRPGFIDRLNSNLPPQIRVFGLKRVTNEFNASRFCDLRRYVYLIPLFALDPSCHRDRQSVLASLGSGNELVKCLECSERGRKVIGIMGKRTFDPESGSRVSTVQSGISSNSGGAELKLKIKEEERVSTVQSGISSNSGGAALKLKIKEEEQVSTVQSGISSNSGGAELKLKIEEEEQVSTVQSGISSISGGAELKLKIKEEEQVIADSLANTDQIDGNCNKNKETAKKVVVKSEFCYGDKERERFNRILMTYEGSHNFKNFIARKNAGEAADKRYIISFDAETAVHVNGIEFVKCELLGESFMLCQIRKMIGLAIAIMRNAAPESLIETAFRPDIKINVPMAPAVGLYLDECFFSSYNKKWVYKLEKLSMKAYAEEAESFKMKYIYPEIASTEHNEGVIALWLHSLNDNNYPEFSCKEFNSSRKS